MTDDNKEEQEENHKQRHMKREIVTMHDNVEKGKEMWIKCIRCAYERTANAEEASKGNVLCGKCYSPMAPISEIALVKQVILAKIEDDDVESRVSTSCTSSKNQGVNNGFA